MHHIFMVEKWRSLIGKRQTRSPRCAEHKTSPLKWQRDQFCEITPSLSWRTRMHPPKENNQQSKSGRPNFLFPHSFPSRGIGVLLSEIFFWCQTNPHDALTVDLCNWATSKRSKLKWWKSCGEREREREIKRGGTISEPACSSRWGREGGRVRKVGEFAIYYYNMYRYMYVLKGILKKYKNPGIINGMWGREDKVVQPW